MQRFTLKVKVPFHDVERIITGRPAWALRELVAAGKRGCSTIETLAPRARYILRCVVTIIKKPVR